MLDPTVAVKSFDRYIPENGLDTRIACERKKTLSVSAAGSGHDVVGALFSRLLRQSVPH